MVAMIRINISNNASYIQLYIIHWRFAVAAVRITNAWVRRTRTADRR
jgi:hypothetical protein